MLIDGELNMPQLVPRQQKANDILACTKNSVVSRTREIIKPSVLGTNKATPQILCSVLGPHLQDRHEGAGVGSEMSNEGGDGSREQVL